MTSVATTPLEYKVVSLDVDSTATELSDALSKLGLESWNLVGTYHIHHLNAIHYVLARPAAVTS